MSFDGDATINYSLGLRPIGQALVEDKGRQYDAMTVGGTKTNQELKIYFNIDKPLNWQKRKLQP